MKMLEHPDITRALRTGYPYIKPVPPADPAIIVTDDEFAQIVARRKINSFDYYLIRVGISSVISNYVKTGLPS